MILTHHGINSLSRYNWKGIFYFTDFKNFDEVNKIDHPKIGAETSYSGLVYTQLTKASDANGNNWLNCYAPSFSKSGAAGVLVDTSSFDSFSCELWFRLNNTTDSYQGNLYLWFEGFNRGYIYDPMFSYADPGINGFCANSDHSKCELFNGVTYGSGLPIATKFPRNINREIVNLSVVYDGKNNMKYSYLNGDLCITEQYYKVNTFNLYPQNNSSHIQCRLTNILLTNEERRSSDKMTYMFNPLVQS